MELVRDKLANNKYRHQLISPHAGTGTDNLVRARNRNTYDRRRTPWREPGASQYVFWARNENGQVFWRYVDDNADRMFADMIITEHFLHCDYRRIDEGIASRGGRLAAHENLIFYVYLREDDNE